MLWAAALPAQDPSDSVRTRVPIPAEVDAARRGARGDTAVKDSVKAPIAAAPRHAGPEIAGRRVTWDREAIFASGALTLPELLAQVPGVTALNAGFIANLSVSSWYGEPGRVRVFLDNVELDPLDPRDGGVADLSTVQLWSLEEVAVERTAGELRVHLRSWRVRLTTAQTRTDVATGAENTNLYRGFFGKRLGNGGVMQIAAQQYSTTSVRTGGDGDALSAFGRFGVARGRLTVDGVATRTGRARNGTTRDPVFGTPVPNAIPGFKGRDLAAYLRAAWSDPDGGGLWAQLIAATVQHVEDTDPAGPTPEDTAWVNPDTAVSQAQYVATLGFTRWGATLAGSARLRVGQGAQRLAPSVRVAWDRRWLSVSAFAERAGPDSTERLDAAVRAMPLAWVHLAASHAVHAPEDRVARGPTRTTSRVEAGVRLWGRWVTGGVIQRSASQVGGLRAFDPELVAVVIPASTGLEASVSGPVVGPISLHWRGVQWSGHALYRPRVESYTELRLTTALEKRLTRGNFLLTGALMHEYRGAFEGPVAGGGLQRAEGAGVFSSLLDIRIGTANIFWYNRNFAGRIYETVPGFMMPRLVQLYGVRWEFWN